MALFIPVELIDQADIKRAASDYRCVAVVDVEQDGRYWKILFSDCRFDRVTTEREFENYLIGLSVGGSNGDS